WVVGAKRGTRRAVKAGELSELALGRDPLSPMWGPPQGVDALEPVDPAPPDMYDAVCGNNRRHRRTKDAEEGGEAGTTSALGMNNPGNWRVLPRSGLLTSGLASGIPPVGVYTWPVRDDAAAGAALPAGPRA